jgi:hypothetical protein
MMCTSISASVPRPRHLRLYYIACLVMLISIGGLDFRIEETMLHTEWFLPSFIPSLFPSQALRLRALQPLSTSPRLTPLKHGPFLPCSVNSPLHTEIACCAAHLSTMTPNTFLFRAPLVPSCAQVALAITILRTKPADMAIRGRCYYTSLYTHQS